MKLYYALLAFFAVPSHGDIEVENAPARRNLQLMSMISEETGSSDEALYVCGISSLT